MDQLVDLSIRTTTARGFLFQARKITLGDTSYQEVLIVSNWQRFANSCCADRGKRCRDSNGEKPSSQGLPGPGPAIKNDPR